MAVNQGGIRVPIISYFNDKGVKAASKSLAGLEVTAGKLAKTFGVTLSAAAAVAFGKKSLDAFAQDQKAAAQLTATLYNLGLAYDGIGVNQFISDLQDATGVMDDQLRPAFQSLITYTLNYAKAQDILKTALNVSAATGADLQSVSEALGNAYNGNMKGLVGLKIGITQTEAKAQSFAQIMKQLNDQFKDAATIDTYQLRLQKLKVAAADAMEYIGQGIAGALATLTADGNIEKTMQNIRNFGKIIAEELIGFAAGIKQLFKDISEIPVVRLILAAAGGAIKWLDKLFGISKAAKADIANFDKKMAADQAKQDAKAIAAAKQQAALNKKLQAQQLADQKKLNAEKDKQVKLDALALKYKQASSIFDEAAIQLQAAAMNKQSDEDYARIKLKQDLMALQAALDAGDLKTAENLAKVVDEDYKRVQAYQAINIAAGIQAGLITNIQAAAKLIPSNLSVINLDNLKSALSYINDLLAALGKLPTGKNGVGTQGAGIGGTQLTPSGTPKSSSGGTKNTPPLGDTAMETYLRDLEGAKEVMAKNAEALKPIVDSGLFDLYYNAQEFLGLPINPYQMTPAQGAAYSQSQVTVNVAGSVTTEKDLIDAIVSGLNDVSASGVKPFVNRLNPEYL